MPQGQLLLRTKGTIALASQSNVTGLITSNAPGNKSGWVDAYLRYGLSLENGAIGSIIAFSPVKQPTGNDTAGMEGVAYMGATVGMRGERQFSFDAHITAENKSAFLSRLNALMSEVLKYGYVQLMTSYESKVYHLIYQDCQQFQVYNMEMAKFTLSFIEPHPELHNHIEPSILG